MKIKVCLLIAALCSAAQAVTISLSPGFGAGLTPSSVPAYVAVGNYGSFDFVGAPTPDLVANFQEFASDTIVGRLQGGYTGFDRAFDLQDIFIAIGDGADLASSSNVAIFQTTSDFPADSSQAGTVIVSVGNANFVESTLAGSIDGATINLVAVPEPSVAILGALGVLGLVRRRR